MDRSDRTTWRHLIAAAGLLGAFSVSADPATPPHADPRTVAEADCVLTPGENPGSEAAARGLAPCSEGVLRDDGTAEYAFGWVPSVVDGRYLQEYDREEFPSGTLGAVCICWRRTRTDDSVDFEVQIYPHDPFTTDEGRVFWFPRFEPVVVIPASVSGVTDDVSGTWTRVEIGAVPVPDGPSFSVGVKWNPSVDRYFFICDDTSTSTPRTNFWFMDDRARGWGAALYTIDPIFDPHRGLMIRTVQGPARLIDVPMLDPRGLAAAAALLMAAAWILLRRR